MEPLAASTAAAILRPAAAFHAELSAVLRDGRVIAGEVLQSSGDGMVTLALGRHRVPAETRLLLDPGQHFLFQVEDDGGELVLRILGGGDPIEVQLLQALRRVVGEDRSVGELLSELAARLRAELASAGSERSALERLLDALPRHAHRAGEDGAALRALFLRSGLRFEAMLAAAVRAGITPEVLERLRTDLKAELLRVLGRLDEGPLREAVARALTAIEAEQLLNLARQRAGEPIVWSFPVSDVAGWTTAQLQILPREHRGRGAETRQDEHTQRIVLDVRFSELGPIRAELVFDEDALAVRLLVTSPELVARLQTDFAELAERLGDGRRTVQLFARVGSPEEIEASHRPLDIRFLREHHLMDVSG